MYPGKDAMQRMLDPVMYRYSLYAYNYVSECLVSSELLGFAFEHSIMSLHVD
jgi:hypothetical protein